MADQSGFLEGRPEQEKTVWGDGTQKLWIPKWRPTPLNIILGGGHWAVGARRKKNDLWVISTYVKKEKLVWARGKRRLQIHVVLTGRQKKADPDAYFKTVCDALVHTKMLIDDDSDGVELAPTTYSRDNSAPGTLITLEDMR